MTDTSMRERFSSLSMPLRHLRNLRGARAPKAVGSRRAPRSPRPEGQRVADRPPVLRHWPLLVLVVVQLFLATDMQVPVVRPLLALATLLGVPTLVLARRAGFDTDSVPARWLYAFGVSLLAVIVVGLVLNTVLPVVGAHHPLQPAVLAVTWFLIDAGLLLWRAEIPLTSDWSWRDAGWRALEARFEPAQALAVVALVLSIVGAVRLNNGAGGAFALAALVFGAAALVALMVLPEGSPGRDARVLALVAAGLLLATSLRGWAITGHDIQAEYLSFTLTNDQQHWQMSALQNAYNACLSVTVLPTVLTQTTGLSGVFVFKVLLQLVFALVPVLTYLFSRRFVSRRLALVATTFTLAFPTFFTDMPYLVRQEIAFFFLALLLLAATEPGGNVRWLRPAVVLFGVGVVLSHYSTTYVMLMGLVFSLIAMSLLRGLGRWWSRLREYDDQPMGLVLLNPFVVAVLVAASLAWAGPVTHTGAHASDVVKQTLRAVTGQASSGPGSSDTSYRLFSKDKTTPRDRLNSYVSETMKYRSKYIPAKDLLVRHPTRPELRPALAPASTAPPTALGRLLGHLGLAPGHVNSFAKVAAAALMQVFLIAGLVWLLLRRRRPEAGQPDEADGTEPHPSREVVYLSIGAVAALALIVLVPNLSVDYGVLRAFQQAMLVLAPVMAAGMWVLLRPLGSRLAWLAVAVPVLLLLVLTGLLPAVLGGNQPRIATANNGTYYDRFYTSDAESQAITWLAQTDANSHYGSKIIANRNVMVKMLTATHNAAPIADRLYPTLLTRDAFVFVDPQIVGKGSSTLFTTGDLITYRYPTQDLDRRLDLVYSSPHTRIYR